MKRLRFTLAQINLFIASVTLIPHAGLIHLHSLGQYRFLLPLFNHFCAASSHSALGSSSLTIRCAHPLAPLGAEPYRIHFPADLLPLEIDGSIPHLRCVFNKWEKPRQKQVMKVILKPLTFKSL